MQDVAYARDLIKFDHVYERERERTPAHIDVVPAKKDSTQHTHTHTKSSACILHQEFRSRFYSTAVQQQQLLFQRWGKKSSYRGNAFCPNTFYTFKFPALQFKMKTFQNYYSIGNLNRRMCSIVISSNINIVSVGMYKNETAHHALTHPWRHIYIKEGARGSIQLSIYNIIRQIYKREREESLGHIYQYVAIYLSIDQAGWWRRRLGCCALLLLCVLGLYIFACAHTVCWAVAYSQPQISSTSGMHQNIWDSIAYIEGKTREIYIAYNILFKQKKKKISIVQHAGNAASFVGLWR